MLKNTGKNLQITNKNGQFTNIEAAVQYKHEELKKSLKGIDLSKLVRK